VARLAVVLAALALSLFAASTAEAAPTEFFGVVQGPWLDAQDLQGMSAANIRTVRFLMLWRSVQPSHGSFDWGTYDWVVGSLASHGIRPVPFVWGSPTWVGSGYLARPPVGSAAPEQAWRDFLKAAVARYGPGGSYWANEYLQQFPGATPLPIQSWQIWSEPNNKLSTSFDPGGTVADAAQKYARLLEISHDAIMSQDPQARIVLAGLAGQGAEVTAWDFLDYLYQVPGVESDFDAAALQPYGCNLNQVRDGIVNVRAAMTSHADGATPLWLSEFAWGSGPPDQYCKNVGPTGQQDLLDQSYQLFLQHRTEWNLQRVYWFFWRDPAPGSAYTNGCSICGSAGLLRYNRTAKPAYDTFTSFTAETTPPVASITSGPSEGSLTRDATPTLGFDSTENGSTFQCRFDGQSFFPCPSPFTRGSPLSDGTHTFFVKAIDAPGNESAVVSRSFTIDAHAPAAPNVNATNPTSPANNNAPQVTGSAEAGTAVTLYTTAGCTGMPVAWGSAAQFPSPGLDASVADNTTTLFRVRATDAAGNTSPCSTARKYVEDSTAPAPPQITATTPASPANSNSPKVRGSAEAGSSVRLYKAAGCTGSPAVTGSATRFASPGLTAPVTDNTTTSFRATATDVAGNISACSNPRKYVEDSTAPQTTITAGPSGPTTDDTPTYSFTSSQAGSTFQCRFDSQPFAACSGPGASHTPSTPLSNGSHRFDVRATDKAKNTDRTPANRTFTVVIIP
jgi:hypothetical protein